MVILSLPWGSLFHGCHADVPALRQPEAARCAGPVTAMGSAKPFCCAQSDPGVVCAGSCQARCSGDEQQGRDPEEPPDRGRLPALSLCVGGGVQCLSGRSCWRERPRAPRGVGAGDVRAVDPYLWQPAQINK